MKNIFFIISSIIMFAYILKIVIKGKFSVTESIFWFLGSIFLIVIAIFPKIIDHIAIMLGIDYPPSLLFLLSTLFLIFINFRLSKKNALSEEKIVELAQRIALLEDRCKNEN